MSLLTAFLQFLKYHQKKNLQGFTFYSGPHDKGLGGAAFEYDFPDLVLEILLVSLGNEKKKEIEADSVLEVISFIRLVWENALFKEEKHSGVSASSFQGLL